MTAPCKNGSPTAKRRYRLTSKGRAARQREVVSPAFRARVLRYQASEQGKATRSRRRNGTPAGRAEIALANSRRRTRSTNPEAYAARVRQMLEQNEPCNHCGITAEQIDHILPLALGGTDDWTNLQALCKPCHGTKTREDLRRIRKVRREY